MNKSLLGCFILVGLTACGGGGGGGNGGAENDANSLASSTCQIIGSNQKSGTNPSFAKIEQGVTCDRETGSAVVFYSLLVRNEDGEPVPKYNCSGTMISANTMVTAAHCFYGLDGINIELINFSGGANKRVLAETIDQFPGYNNDHAFHAGNDIAIVRFSESLGLPTMPVAAELLVSKGDEVLIYGYGTTSDHGNSDNELKGGTMIVDEVEDTSVFALYNGEGANTCQGDSGGPLIKLVDGRPVLVGITSGGSVKDCVVGDRSYFTSVASPFIQAFIRALAPEAEYVSLSGSVESPDTNNGDDNDDNSDDSTDDSSDFDDYYGDDDSSDFDDYYGDEE